MFSRLGARLARPAAALSCSSRSSRLWPGACPGFRQTGAYAYRSFCIESSTPLGGSPKPRPSGRRGGTSPAANLGKAGAIIIAGVGVGYLVSKDVQEEVDMFLAQLGEWFEDFNDSSREFFESLGDRLISKKPDDDEPWLLELATMKYPENIPTLVLDVDKVILKLEHDSKAGWQVIKRPYADQFFKEIPHYFEVVLFSDEVFPTALEIATKWNLPITGALHRDFCKKKRHGFIKDLSKLGRKMDRVLLVDHDPLAYSLQPRNGIQIREFHGDPNDTELADLLDFLKAAAGQPDLREYVEKFGGGDVDLGKRYLLYKQEQDKASEKRRSVGRLFGGKPGMAPGGLPGVVR